MSASESTIRAMYSAMKKTVVTATASAILLVTGATAASAGPLALTRSDRAAAPFAIAFARQIKGGGANVFTANPDGSGVHQVPLTSPAEDFGTPHWSPDRTQLLISNTLRFTRSGNLLPFRPATVNLDGSHYRILQPPNPPFDINCQAWTVNGRRIVCDFGEGPAGAFSLNATNGGEPQRLTTNLTPRCSSCDEPTDTSPDGKRFLFVRSKNEHSKHKLKVALFTENLDGSGQRQITPYGLAAPDVIASAHWSPDGREIISATTKGHLFVIHPNGTSLRQIRLQPDTKDYFAFEPDFSPDGSHIVFCMTIHRQEDIYTAKADGSNIVQITNTADFENGPDWGRKTRHTA
jgi:Tol biopolymer transport system component